MTVWLAIFALTCLLEAPVYLLVLRPLLQLPRALLLLLLLNLVTHPVVWFLLPRLLESQVHYVLVAEGFAILVEGLIIFGLARRLAWPGWGCLSALGLAFLANAFSATVGELVGYRLVGWLGLLPPG